MARPEKVRAGAGDLNAAVMALNHAFKQNDMTYIKRRKILLEDVSRLHISWLSELDTHKNWEAVCCKPTRKYKTRAKATIVTNEMGKSMKESASDSMNG